MLLWGKLQPVQHPLTNQVRIAFDARAQQHNSEGKQTSQPKIAVLLLLFQFSLQYIEGSPVGLRCPCSRLPVPPLEPFLTRMTPNPVQLPHNPCLDMMPCINFWAYTQCLREGRGVGPARYVFQPHSSCLFCTPPPLSRCAAVLPSSPIIFFRVQFHTG